MAANQQLALLEDFETSRPPNPLFCHQEFLEKLAEHGRDAIGRRAAFLMQRLYHGSHFYAWWAFREEVLAEVEGWDQPSRRYVLDLGCY